MLESMIVSFDQTLCVFLCLNLHAEDPAGQGDPSYSLRVLFCPKVAKVQCHRGRRNAPNQTIQNRSPKAKQKVRK